VSENYFDERVASTYEAKWPELFEPALVEATVSFLQDRAGAGPALELGIGTGRIALPLSRGGLRVHGIELSPAMIAELRTKPGADAIVVTLGDFATTTVDGAFSLAYLVRNTIMNLTTQDEQVACFRNVAACLAPGGCFVVEVMVPELQRLPPGETIHAFTVTPAHLGFEEYDVARQIAISHHYWVVDGRLETVSAPFRYVWPSELDLMARLAGMTLRERWSGWTREPFTSDSRSHVSVWEKTP
jgi:SAM-dependent methyltransferase